MFIQIASYNSIRVSVSPRKPAGQGNKSVTPKT